MTGRIRSIRRSGMNPAARLKILRRRLEALCDVLSSIEIDPHIVCGECRWYEEEGDSACDMCYIPEYLADIQSMVEDALDVAHECIGLARGEKIKA